MSVSDVSIIVHYLDKHINYKYVQSMDDPKICACCLRYNYDDDNRRKHIPYAM